ncbi:uncharacterized protein MONOS_7907 [Monocercomonoides exilis]|uniref:uncharacterized protein n=1 Tax=Monocercomonoides exilis TaxID=2049356 RepID=UPI003559386D|nr:hypothetical protein MONOS_7907 [Monocercomonoides exilis]|eukprot:MONOS_7907.1-p1 / transcript=MONOS_7907.1 / gene=MONOS_7907 / organism=Monocercomonoides_exilis_PA203 / gene_product=unspecified product / transcript_product=unspecified product / location=Mono_scaffold00283:66560-69089(+) / protein_length=741 / sequence_SO=supercontig / SO=protein_coding / is_pseudo=false
MGDINSRRSEKATEVVMELAKRGAKESKNFHMNLFFPLFGENIPTSFLIKLFVKKNMTHHSRLNIALTIYFIEKYRQIEKQLLFSIAIHLLDQLTIATSSPHLWPIARDIIFALSCATQNHNNCNLLEPLEIPIRLIPYMHHPCTGISLETISALNLFSIVTKDLAPKLLDHGIVPMICSILLSTIPAIPSPQLMQPLSIPCISSIDDSLTNSVDDHSPSCTNAISSYNTMHTTGEAAQLNEASISLLHTLSTFHNPVLESAVQTPCLFLRIFDTLLYSPSTPPRVTAIIFIASVLSNGTAEQIVLLLMTGQRRSKSCEGAIERVVDEKEAAWLRERRREEEMEEEREEEEEEKERRQKRERWMEAEKEEKNKNKKRDKNIGYSKSHVTVLVGRKMAFEKEDSNERGSSSDNDRTIHHSESDSSSNVAQISDNEAALSSKSSEEQTTLEAASSSSSSSYDPLSSLHAHPFFHSAHVLPIANLAAVPTSSYHTMPLAAPQQFKADSEQNSQNVKSSQSNCNNAYSEALSYSSYSPVPSVKKPSLELSARSGCSNSTAPVRKRRNGSVFGGGVECLIRSALDDCDENVRYYSVASLHHAYRKLMQIAAADAKEGKEKISDERAEKAKKEKSGGERVRGRGRWIGEGRGRGGDKEVNKDPKGRERRLFRIEQLQGEGVSQREEAEESRGKNRHQNRVRGRVALNVLMEQLEEEGMFDTFVCFLCSCDADLVGLARTAFFASHC